MCCHCLLQFEARGSTTHRLVSEQLCFATLRGEKALGVKWNGVGQNEIKL